MAINYVWNISELERNSSDGFVVTAHYRVVAEDSGTTADTYGTVSWTQSDQEFIPYDELTPEQVVAWVQEKLDKTVVEESLAQQIATLKTPTVLHGVPWGQNFTQADSLAPVTQTLNNA